MSESVRFGQDVRKAFKTHLPPTRARAPYPSTGTLRQLYPEHLIYKFLLLRTLNGRLESPVYFKTRIGKEHFLIDALMVVHCSQLDEAFMPHPICRVLRYIHSHKSNDSIDTGHQEALFTTLHR